MGMSGYSIEAKVGISIGLITKYLPRNIGFLRAHAFTLPARKIQKGSLVRQLLFSKVTSHLIASEADGTVVERKNNEELGQLIIPVR
jgi:hypothetical protein